MDLNESDLEIMEYYLDTFEDDVFKSAESMDNMMEQITTHLDDLKTLKEGYDELIKEYNNGAGLMTDAAGLHEDGFGSFYTSYDESTTFEPALFYLYEGEVKKNIDADNKKLVTANKISTILSTSIKNSINFLKSL